MQECLNVANAGNAMILARKKKARKSIRARWAARPSSAECPKRMEVSLASAFRIETLFYREEARFVCRNRRGIEWPATTRTAESFALRCEIDAEPTAESPLPPASHAPNPD